MSPPAFIEQSRMSVDQPSSSSSDSECRVCAHTAHGVHFGVLSCRACAAFFRRSVVMDKKYSCRKASQGCRIDKSERYLCRLCRYKKCLQLGMTADNVQWNRDMISSTDRKRQSEEDDATDVDAYSDWSPGSKKSCLDAPPLYDLSRTLNKIHKTFMEFKIPVDDPVYQSTSTLGKMDWALRRHRKNKKMQNFRIINTIRLDQLVDMWGMEMTKQAEFMMHSEEFRELSLEEKFSIFKLVWQVSQRFEKLTMSLEIFGKRAIEEKILITSNSTAIRMEDVEIDLSKITDYTSLELRKMFQHVCSQMYEEVARPLMELDPSTIEISYMLCQIIWHIAGKTLQGDILDAGEKFIGKIADDLHQYYLKEYKMSNYAGRLIKLMTVVNSLQRIHLDRLKIMELAKIFEVFKVKVTDPCVFQD
ncbi:Nuclear Hormone Receptor family [Caenorhabditis elegans]|nr:Nuclear Hormone Receptor family [Caenorhabditis elegans]CCD67867.1 Nuclear Hormone Receptor family [Caenorhabditis elegans]|eukprot:NP_504518.3 Nuclear Hormone Receptor family [Caenorhabditis elegans]